MTAWYNENDPFAAAWLRKLVAAGLITPGDVDERSIVDVRADDLQGYAQCHFFAGIGGWSYALRLAGWDDARPVWTGSCPCQPFSSAGKRQAFKDDRHLWPAWLRLIRECRPPIIFGEQTSEAIGWGWIDSVAYELEAADYAFGTAIIPACAVGAKHLRERIWFLADAASERWLADGRQQRLQGGDQTRQVYFRPSEPGVPCMVDDVPGRMAFVRAFGNAIVPRVAAEFVRAYIEGREERDGAYGDRAAPRDRTAPGDGFSDHRAARR
jgi:DNA (cytosine-5)-methyltransferase 1